MRRADPPEASRERSDASARCSGAWREALHVLERQLIETLLALLHTGHELFAHPFGPKTRNMIGNTRDGIFAPRLRPKKVADVVGHLNQLVAAAYRMRLLHGRKALLDREH